MVGLFKDGLGTFNDTAMKEALDLIEALALTEQVQPVHIRVAPGLDGATWLDLGRNDGQSVRIHPTGWDIRTPDPAEVCWRRTQLTGELPLWSGAVDSCAWWSSLVIIGYCRAASDGPGTAQRSAPIDSGAGLFGRQVWPAAPGRSGDRRTLDIQRCSVLLSQRVP